MSNTEQWEIVKTKWIFKVVNGGTPSSSVSEYWDGEIIWLTPEDLSKLKEKYISNSKRMISKLGVLNSSANIVPENSLVVSKRAPIGYIAIAKTELTTNQGCFSLVPIRNDINVGYFYYQLLSKTSELKSLGQGTTFNELSSSNMSDFLLYMPTLSLQNIIVEFLNKETSKIDNLIEKKQRLIELLQEKRQALITNAVTKGLDPNVPMKDSGIPWLGEVPEHWDVKRLRFMLEMNPGKSELTGISEELQVSFLPMESVSEDGDIELDRHKPLSEVFSGYTYFKDRDVILAKITPCFENGKGALVDNLMNSIGFGSTEFHVLRPKQNKLDEKYLYYIIKSHAFMNIGESMMTGAAGQKRVPEDFIKNYKIGLPPYLEQKTIVKKLEKKLSDIRALTEKLLTQITKLQEYRQALITAAVTGKIDVREKVSS